VGAHGDKFDFKGADHMIYAMFSARDFAVNARFEHDVYSLGRTEVHGSFITESFVSVRLAGRDPLHVAYSAACPHSATITTGGHHQIALAISPFDVNEAAVDSYELDGLRVQLSKSHMNEATLLISNGFWQVTCRSRLYPYSTTNHGKKRLDLSFMQLEENAAAKVAPHGVVGQTFDGDDFAVFGAQDDYTSNVVVTKAMGEGAIEGTAADYVVKSPYSVDFAYSRFDAEAATPRDVSKLSGVKKKVQHARFMATGTNDNPSDI